jgi:hypothetical protein
MKSPALLLFSIAFLMPAQLSAATSCPWLTKGSAATALGGSVSATVQVSESGEGTCTFTREEATSKDNFKDVLKISVQKAPPQPSCPAGSPKLAAIGNEAVTCTLRRQPQQSVEMIVSRVRDLHFTVSITTHKQGAQPTNQDQSADALEQVAEQVAGNLF